MKTIYYSTILFFLLFGLSGCDSYMNTQWFMDRGNLAMTAFVPKDIQPPLDVRWECQLNGPVVASVVGNNEALFVGAGSTMYCIHPNTGEIIWQYPLGALISSTALVIQDNKGADQFLYFIAENGELHCLNARNGELIWVISAPFSGAFNSSLNYASGMLFYSYMSSGIHSTLRAVNAETGTVIWESEPFNITTTTPLHGFGKVFYGGCQQSLTPMKAFRDGTGSIEWFAESALENTQVCYTNGTIDTEVEVGDYARFIFPRGAFPAVLTAVNPETGEQIWQHDLSGDGEVFGMAVSQHPEGRNVVVVTQSGRIYGIDPVTGSESWRRDYSANATYSRGRISPRPAIAGHYVYHICHQKYLKVFDLFSGQELWSADVGNTFSSPTVGENTIYIGNNEGLLRAFSR